MTGDRRVAFYVPSLTIGGAERVTVTVANGLADHGYDIDLLVSYHEGAFVDDVADAVTLVDFGTPRIPGVGVGASVPALISYFRDYSPAIVFSQMTYANDVCLFAHWLAGSDAVVVPTVHTTVGTEDAPKERLVERLAGVLSGRADQFVAVSDGAAESVVERFGVAPERVSVLHNPVPVSEVRERATESVDHRWLGTDHDVMLGLGRLEAAKDFGTFLRAFRRVHEHQPNARAIIVGSGSERDALETTARDLGVADAVSFPGHAENPYGYMARADVFVMSSVREGLPTVLIEALACGCPVVSTDCPSGPRTILGGGEFGPLVPVSDDRALADAVLSTLRDPLPAATLRERAADFEPAVALDDYEAFIRSHVQRPAKRP
jgi:glycosyltransferase involved in cell wall biosynthesis